MILIDQSIFLNLDYNPYLVRIPHDVYRQIKLYAILNRKKYKDASKTSRTELKVVLNIIAGKCGEWAYQMLCEYQLQNGVFNLNFGLQYKNVSLLSRTHDFELGSGQLIDVKTVPYTKDAIRRRVYVSDGEYNKTYVLMRMGYDSQTHFYYCEYIGQILVDSRNSKKISPSKAPYHGPSGVRRMSVLLAAISLPDYMLNTPIVFDNKDRPYIKIELFYNRHTFDYNLSTYTYECINLFVYYNSFLFSNWLNKPYDAPYIPYIPLTLIYQPTDTMYTYNREDYISTAITNTNTSTSSCIVHTTGNPSPGVYTTTTDWGPSYRHG